MARFEVNPGEMVAAANNIAQEAQNFLDAASQVIAGAEALGQTWEGDSQVAFMNEQQQANEWYKKMVDIVNTYVTMLQEGARKYEEGEVEVTGTITAR